MSKYWEYEEMDDTQGFPGEVAAVEKSSGEYGEQVDIHVRPMTHQTKSGGPYHVWLAPSTKKQSKMGEMVKALGKLGVKLPMTVGDDGKSSVDTMVADFGVLVGMKFQWEETTLDWKVRDQDDKTKEKEVKLRLPVAAVDDNGVIIGGQVQKPAGLVKKPSGVATAAKAVVGKAPATFPADKVASFKELLLNGTSKDGLTRWGDRNKVSAEAISAQMKKLDEAGNLEANEEGTFLWKE